MVTLARDNVDFFNKIWVGCEEQVKNVSLLSWFRYNLSKVEIICNVHHFPIDSGRILWVWLDRDLFPVNVGKVKVTT